MNILRKISKTINRLKLHWSNARRYAAYVNVVDYPLSFEQWKHTVRFTIVTHRAPILDMIIFPRKVESVKIMRSTANTLTFASENPALNTLIILNSNISAVNGLANANYLRTLTIIDGALVRFPFKELPGQFTSLNLQGNKIHSMSSFPDYFTCDFINLSKNPIIIVEIKNVLHLGYIDLSDTDFEGMVTFSNPH